MHYGVFKSHIIIHTGRNDLNAENVIRLSQINMLKCGVDTHLEIVCLYIRKTVTAFNRGLLNTSPLYTITILATNPDTPTSTPHDTSPSLALSLLPSTFAPVLTPLVLSSPLPTPRMPSLRPTPLMSTPLLSPLSPLPPAPSPFLSPALSTTLFSSPLLPPTPHPPAITSSRPTTFPTTLSFPPLSPLPPNLPLSRPTPPLPLPTTPLPPPTILPPCQLSRSRLVPHFSSQPTTLSTSSQPTPHSKLLLALTYKRRLASSQPGEMDSPQMRLRHNPTSRSHFGK